MNFSYLINSHKVTYRNNFPRYFNFDRAPKDNINRRYGLSQEMFLCVLLNTIMKHGQCSFYAL